MVAAEHGLFHSYEQQLLFSPVNEIVENMTINDLSLSGEANNEKLWLAASDGLFLVSDKSFDQISFGSEQGTPISVASSTSMAVVSFGSAVYELDIAPWAYSIAPSGLGNVVGVEVVDNIFYLASDRGLIRREANGAYTLFTMSNNGNEPVVAVGGNDSSGLFALTGAGLASVNENTATGIAPLTSMPTQPLVAADGYGNAWVANGTQLTNVMVGHSVSFEAKVATILETNCNTCHITGYDAPVHDFANYDEAVALAETIIQRVSLGQMPPPPMPALSTEDFDTLVSWYATGMNP